ncbi:autoinducer binding domain-containing protein [Pontibacterium sp.]|uniref:helix-turn-helix transcriptional regulator n=1 Tax=Pontibacterium sp. TaxID=2036026 RepID=UPI00351945C1
MDDLWQLMETLNTSTSFEQLGENLDRLIQQFDVEHYVYLNLSPLAAKVASTGNYPESWVTHYLEQEYQFVDPTAKGCMLLQKPFLWRDCDQIFEPTELTQRFWNEAAEYNLTSGLGIPQRSFDKSTVGWGMTFRTRDEEQYLKEHGKALSVVANSFHYRFEQLLASNENLSQTFRLTKRERECVMWLCEGKTYPEIEIILGISERTVRHHISAAKNKLDIATNAQLIAKSVLYRLV